MCARAAQPTRIDSVRMSDNLTDGSVEMNRQQTPQQPPGPVPEAEIQQGQRRSIVMDERVKRVLKQHPQRDAPRVDSVEPDETPATRPMVGRRLPK